MNASILQRNWNHAEVVPLSEMVRIVPPFPVHGTSDVIKAAVRVCASL